LLVLAIIFFFPFRLFLPVFLYLLSSLFLFLLHKNVEQFRYLETILTNKYVIYEEIKSRLKSGNACYYSVQNLLSSSLQSKDATTEKSACFFFERV